MQRYELLPTPRPPVHNFIPQTYRERPAAAVASSHLSTVWIQRVAPEAGPYVHRTVPHGSVELAVEIGAQPRLVGPQAAPVVGTLAPGATVVGVRFHPGAAAALLGMPASELLDLEVDGDELLGRSAVALGEAVAAAASPQDAAAIVEQAIVDRIAVAPAPDPVVAHAVRRLLPWGTNDVAALARSLYISERQLRRRMTTAIGLAPKSVQRILRFQTFLALAHARAMPGADLALLAAESGYADQSHLTRESLRLSGLTPRALLLETLENCVGVHDHTASWAPLLRARVS